MQRINRASLVLCFILFALSATTAFATNFNYSVLNQTNESLGLVSIRLADGTSQNAEVGANQEIVFNVSASIVSITINGQTFLTETISIVILPSGNTAEIVTKQEDIKIIR